jgi:hypothetical protein
VAIDKLVLQLDSLDDPTGDGPAVSSVVPEPSSISLLALGALGLAGYRRRQHRRAHRLSH